MYAPPQLTLLRRGSVKHTLSFSRRHFARVLSFRLRLLLRRGRREGPGARRTRGLVCIDAQTKVRTRAYRFGGSTPAFPAQWLYDLYVLSLATRLSCHHHPRDAKHHREFDANPGASGPHAFIVRKGLIRRAFAPEAFASTAACPNVS